LDGKVNGDIETFTHCTSLQGPEAQIRLPGLDLRRRTSRLGGKEENRMCAKICHFWILAIDCGA
jgi:hypothetical protein